MKMILWSGRPFRSSLLLLPILLLLLLMNTAEADSSGVFGKARGILDMRPEVTIRSDPEGATVKTVDGKVLGISTFKMRVEKGATLDLIFELDGYYPFRESYVGINSSITVLAKLPKVAGPVVGIRSNPPASSIEFSALDGTPIQAELLSDRRDLQSDSVYRLPIGTQEVRVQLRARKYRTISRVQRIEAMDNRLLFEFQRMEIPIEINSIPSGADVYERSIGFLGRTPVRRVISWEDMIRLSPSMDPSDVQSIPIYLRITKSGYMDHESVDELSLTSYNPRIEKNLQPLQ